MMLTRDEVEKALPANLKGAATQQFTDHINNVTTDPIMAENIRDNFISYTTVLADGRYRTTDYLNAVVYVSYKVTGLSNQEAYAKTFPARYQQLVTGGATSRELASYVTQYNKGKLVNAILEQTLTPIWVLNQDVYQKAINVQVDLMTSAQSEKVRCEAANSILVHLAKPKEAAAAVAIQINANSGMDEMKDMLMRLADAQVRALNSGVTTAEIAAQPLIEGKAKVTSNV
jgi:hypothetical protein